MRVRLFRLAGTRAGSSTPLRLGDAIGSGGEGTVHRIDGDERRVVKVYAEPPGEDQVAKLEAMIATGDAELERVAAWPDALVAGDGGVVGFTMPKLASQLPLHELFGPRRRQELFSEAHWAFLIHAATNVARAFETLHERDVVIGDVNSNNVVIHRTSKTRFIDCDSFQIRRDGRLYRCNVGVPDYQPPELQAVDLGTAERTTAHDRFGLAVMIFQLLFVGKHPFAGIVPLEFAADATIGANIAAHRYFYADGATRAGLRPPPGGLALAALPAPIGALFARAFEGAPAERPTAAEWRVALRDLESTTVPCERSRRHRFVRGAACPWCELERSGLFYFAPHEDDPAPVDDSAWQRFPDREVERVWSTIAALRPAPPGPDPVGRRPRRDARTAALAIAALAARAGGSAAARAIVRERRAQLDAARDTFRADYARWRELAALVPFTAERARLEKLRTTLLAQRTDRDREVSVAHNAQYALDQATFLAQFPIPRVPQVPGSLVTPSGPTTGIENRQMRELARYGITNASHVTVASLRAVPLLRSWRFDVLIEWRMSLDAQFAALPVRDLDIRVRRTIEGRYSKARETVGAEFVAGAERLRELIAAMERERAELEARLPAEAAAYWAADDAAAIAPFRVNPATP